MLNINGIESEVLTAVEGLMAGSELSKFHFLAEGKSGAVYQYLDSPYGIKVMKEDAKETVDPYILSLLQQAPKDADKFTKLYAYEPNKFMITEFVPGQTIYQADGKNGDLLNEYRKELMKAEEAAMSVGLLPSDVHLNNMMISESGEFKIVDVGNFKPMDIERMEKLEMMGFFFSSSSHHHRRHHRHSSSYSHSSSSHRHRHGHGHRHHRHHSGMSISSFISEVFSS